MPLKLNVGLSQKVGLPDYGSLGASCHVEVELDQSLIFDDVQGFHERAKHAFAACRQAVRDELARQQESRPAQSAANGAKPQPNTASSANGNAPHASQKQLDYAGQLAGQIRGLGSRRLEALAQKMFAKPLAELSTLDASGLIDALKDIKAGKIDLKAILNGAGA